MHKCFSLVFPLCVIASLVIPQAEGAVTFSLNFSDAAAADGIAPGPNFITDLAGVAKITFLAQSVVAFHDLDSNGLDAGDTFDDYILIRATSFAGPPPGNAGITNIGYGTTHQLTAVAKFSGVQGPVSGASSTYAFTSMSQFDFFFDAGTFPAGVGMTPADFSAPATFSDGVLVELATSMLLGGGTQTAFPLPNGTVSIVVTLADNLSTLDPAYDAFEYNVLNNGVPINVTDLLLGIVDANNTPEAAVISAYASYFGFDPDIGDQYDFFIGASNDGSLVKAVVPEPASMLIWAGMGLAGVVGAYRRRQKLAA